MTRLLSRRGVEGGSFLWEGDLIEGLGISTGTRLAGIRESVLVLASLPSRRRDGFSSYMRLL